MYLHFSIFSKNFHFFFNHFPDIFNHVFMPCTPTFHRVHLHYSHLSCLTLSTPCCPSIPPHGRPWKSHRFEWSFIEGISTLTNSSGRSFWIAQDNLHEPDTVLSINCFIIYSGDLFVNWNMEMLRESFWCESYGVFVWRHCALSLD